MRKLIAMLPLFALGCPKSTSTSDPAPSASVAAAAPSAAASASATPAAKSGPRSIAGVGDVPAWAADPAGTKCTTSAAAKTKIAELSKGKDSAMSAGTADPGALANDTGAATCAVTRKDLANALNDGGYERYKAKKFDEADRWWRAALVVRPSAITPRYNLACGLALEGKPKDAIAEIQELARAAADGDASAVNQLEKAKSDADLVSIREDADFKKAIAEASSAGGILVGPRKEPELSKEAVGLLPADYKKTKDQIGFTADGWITYSPALLQTWTWHPESGTDLLVGTFVDDPAKIGKPKGDMNQDYGAIAVFKRDVGGATRGSKGGDSPPEGKLSLLFSAKTGESPPTGVAAKGKDIAYTFETMCGTIKGTITFSGGKVTGKETPCSN